jgi:hypothetical protein
MVPTSTSGGTISTSGLLLKNKFERDSSWPYAAMEVEEEIHREAVEEAEEHRLLRSPRPHPRQLFLRQLTSKLWEPPQEYSKETEPKRKISSMNYDTTTASTEELPDSIPP